MRKLWKNLWGRISRFMTGRENPDDPDEKTEETVFDELSSLYSAPGRVYHTFDHIAFCLAEFESCRSLLLHPDRVETAIWFHDAVYDPASTVNEVRSASLAEKLLSDTGFDRNFIHDVSALVSVTAHVEGMPLPFTLMPDVEYLLDLDLSVLGADMTAYDAYREAIRKEYGFLSDDAFREGRSVFLEGFLARKRVFLTDRYRNRLEERARSNIIRELSMLDRR